MFWTDGSFYQGEWKQGIQHGYGKMTFPDGSTKEGRFENNIFLGDQSDTLQPSDSEGSSHKKSARQLLQPLLIKKSTNENKNYTNGYNSSGSSGIKTTLRTIKEETPTITKAPANLQPVMNPKEARPPRAVSRPGGGKQTVRDKSNPMNSSIEGFHRDHSSGEKKKKAPAQLNPVQPPLRRVAGDMNTSLEIT
jgi:hypothetical protein